jgi:uncharacterized ion transporter superfamily protein YfcC
MSESKHSYQGQNFNKENDPSFHAFKSQTTKTRSLEETINQDYGESISLTQELKEQETSTEDCLRNHRINEELRSKMVDWMVEVLDIFGCSLRTLFLSVRLMDLFFKSETSTIGIEELHVVGVTCMMIASKYEDIKALDMNTIFYKIAHERLPKTYIVMIEKKILKVLDYKLFIPTVLDFLEPLVHDAPKHLKNLAYFAAELALIDSRFAWVKPSVIANAVFSVVFGKFHGFAGMQNEVVDVANRFKVYLNSFDLPYQSSCCKYKMRPRF